MQKRVHVTAAGRQLQESPWGTPSPWAVGGCLLGEVGFRLRTEECVAVFTVAKERQPKVQGRGEREGNRQVDNERERQRENTCCLLRIL